MDRRGAVAAFAREDVLLLRSALVRGGASSTDGGAEILPVVDSELGVVADKLVVDLLSELVGVLEDGHLRAQALNEAFEVGGAGCVECLLDNWVSGAHHSSRSCS